MSLTKIFQMGIICAVFFTFILYNMRTVAETVTIFECEETVIDFETKFYEVVKENNELKAKMSKFQQKMENQPKEILSLPNNEDYTKQEKAERLVTWKRLRSHLKTPNQFLNDWQRYEKESYLMSERIVDATSIKMDALGFYRGFTKTVRAESNNGKNQINRDSDARGIIQFTVSMRNKHNIPHNINEYKMYKQLPFIESYFMRKIKTQWTDSSTRPLDQSKIDEWFDVYMLVFAPAMSDDDDDAITYRSPSRAYKSNKGYDRNKNGLIERYEFKKYIHDKYFN